MTRPQLFEVSYSVLGDETSALVVDYTPEEALDRHLDGLIEAEGRAGLYGLLEVDKVSVLRLPMLKENPSPRILDRSQLGRIQFNAEDVVMRKLADIQHEKEAETADEGMAL